MLAQQECRTRPVAGRCWNFWETQRLVFVDSIWKKKRHWTEGTPKNHRCWLIAVWFSSVGRSHFSLVCRGEKSRLHLKSCCCYYLYPLDLFYFACVLFLLHTCVHTVLWSRLDPSGWFSVGLAKSRSVRASLPSNSLTALSYSFSILPPANCFHYYLSLS